MIITRTPLRVSFFGGGTDYPAYYLRCGGATLGTAIDKYVYVTVQHLTEFFDHRIQVHYSKVESVRSLDEIQIPNVREALRMLGLDQGVEIHLVGDLPARTGLGSSSATTVGLLKALRGHLGQLASELNLAREAVRLEQEVIGERVGGQDQYLAACGGFLHLQFQRDGDVRVHPLPIGRTRLREFWEHLLIVYTGVQRTAHEVVAEQLDKTADGQLDAPLGIMKDQVAEAIDLLLSNRGLEHFGRLLHRGWELKRGLSSKVSNPQIDQLYAKARAAGALGGKLLGAGAGGFVLLFVKPSLRQTVKDALGLREVRFEFEPQGTAIVYHRH